MSIVKEISRRSRYEYDEGIACGPVSTTLLEAEIVIEEDGQPIYLYAQWVDVAGEIYFMATKESAYGISEQIMKADTQEKQDQLVEEFNRIDKEKLTDDDRFKEYYNELETMIIEEAKAHDLGYCFEDDEYDDEDED